VALSDDIALLSKVPLFAGLADDKLRLMAFGAGTLLSELAMISAVERKYTAVAVEDSEVIRINRPLFRRMLEEYPDVAVLVDARIRENLGAMISQMRGLAGRFA
jgi:CRP-like cAMP-binding protein